MKDIIGTITMVVWMAALTAGVLNAVVIFAAYIMMAITA